MENDDFKAEAYFIQTFGNLFQENEEKGVKIHEPVPKRSSQSRMQKQEGYKKGKKEDKKNTTEKNASQGHLHSSNKSAVGSKLKDRKIKQDEKQKSKDDFKEKNFHKILHVVRFVFDEFTQEGKQLLKPNNLFYKWQVQQIAINTKDTILGDFIMKLPNPDNLSDQYKKLFPEPEEENQLPEINYEEAGEMYNNIFDLNDTSNIYQSGIEKDAFSLCFYFLDLHSRVEIEEELKNDAHKFFIDYSFYNKIKEKDLKQYYKFTQQSDFKQEKEKLSDQIKQILWEISDKCDAFAEEYLIELEKFQKYKEDIYKPLKEIVDQCSKEVDSKKATAMLEVAPSLVDFLEGFPEFCEKLLQKAVHLDEEDTRKIYGGQYMVKTAHQGEIVWYIKNRRPRDILTLLRKFLFYRLTQKGKLFLRPFLAKNQQQIFVVIKSSQEIMEEYSQNNEISMEVEVGSTDLFSFQPVDSYLRPLRVNPYVRDRSFIRKYNLDVDKKDKDDDLGEASIEAESINIYKKGEEMNKDELRAKIILDQEQVDKCYDWLSRKLGVSYIKHDDVIFNSYNDEVIDDDVWEIYYVWNKFIIEYTKRVKQMVQQGNPKSEFTQTINNNLGLLLRLMFLKALYMCNNLYYHYRQVKGLLPRGCVNLFKDKKVFKNLWDYLNIEVPKGFWPYIKIDKLERMWKKYQVNELKDRSKFFPSERLVITNRIIRNTINISKALTEKYIMDFYPIHDPFLLKNIKISPYLKIIKKQVLDENQKKQLEKEDGANSVFNQYICKYNKLDFTEESIEQKLAAKCGKLSVFSIDTVRYYCGSKLAMYFEFMRFLALETIPYVIVAFILQAVLWGQAYEITQTGSSQLTTAVNYITVVLTVLNIFWTLKTVANWRKKEKKLAQEFGMTGQKDMQEDEKNKRIQFEGRFKRNFLNDEINFEYIPIPKKILSGIFTFIINLSFVAVMGLSIFGIFILKIYLYQSGEEQIIVDQVPAILISVSIKVFNFLYTKLIYTILQFENHKTVQEYESSLVSKSYIITFINTFYSLIFYAFIAERIQGNFLCKVKTQSGSEIEDCRYYMVNQLQSNVIVQFVMTFVAAFTPYITFQITQIFSGNTQPSTQFNTNHLQSVDEYFEEQDKMSTYMYDDELDKSWLGYIKFVGLFSSLALFGNALPLIYLMLYLTGIVGIHAGKYEIIYLSKRTIPINTGHTSLWLSILEVVSIVGILSNLAYMIYVREIFQEDKGSIFFFLFVACLIIRYILSFEGEEDDKMIQRNKIRTFNIINDKGLDFNENKPADLDFDIINVKYDEEELKRRFPDFAKANLRPRK